jgi:hypothetical protein
MGKSCARHPPQCCSGALQACEAQLTGPLGSSKYFSPTMYMSYYMTDDAATNPLLWQTNHVDIPYCSQDLHSGTVTQPTPSTYGLYFSGHLVFQAVVEALIANHGMGDATDIILSGASAGGIGVWINVDWLAARLPSARVVAAPIAGFYYYAYPYTGVNHTSSILSDFTPPAWPQHYALWQSYVPPACAAALNNTLGPWACMLSNYSLPYIGADAFVVEAQTDEVVLLDHDWVPQPYVTAPPEQMYLAEWHANMTQALAPLMAAAQPRYGVFNAACFIHTDFYFTGPLIQGACPRGRVFARGLWFSGCGRVRAAGCRRRGWKAQ